MCINHNNKLIEQYSNQFKNYIETELHTRMPLKTIALND